MSMYKYQQDIDSNLSAHVSNLTCRGHPMIIHADHLLEPKQSAMIWRRRWRLDTRRTPRPHIVCTASFAPDHALRLPTPETASSVNPPNLPGRRLGRLLFRLGRQFKRPCVRSRRGQQAASHPLAILRRRSRLMSANKAFRTSLDQKNVSHLWHVDSGAHTWPVWKNDLYLMAQRLLRDGRSDAL